MESGDEVESNPPEISEAAKENTLNLLPSKIRERYEFVYKQFMKWCKQKRINSFSENVFLEYFTEQSTKIAPTTLWTQYSMLKSTMSFHQNVYIAQYVKLKAFLKRKSHGYKPKKCKTFTSEEINRYLHEAPDDTDLLHKIVLVVGISGACRKHELVQLKVDNITDLGSSALFKIPDLKTKGERFCTITGEFYQIYKKYAALRPSNLAEKRFFLNYRNERCIKQVVGVNKIVSTPKHVATYLGLQEPELYTTHCFRHSSPTVDAGGGNATLKRHGAEVGSDIEEASQKRFKTEDTMLNSIDDSASSLDSVHDQIKIEDTILNSLEDDASSSSTWVNTMERLVMSKPKLKADATASNPHIEQTLQISQQPVIFYNCNNSNITINFVT